MKRPWIAAAVAVLALALLAAIVAGSRLGRSGAAAQAAAASAAASAPLRFRADEVLVPQRVAMPERILFSGPLVAPATAVLRAKASGTLLTLAVAEGDRVNAGQRLGQIELADLGSRLAERSAAVDAARTALAQAERSHANNERLAAQQFISASALDASRAALDTARAQLQAAQAGLETTRSMQREALLVAPIAGIVAKRQVLPGEKLSPEQPVLTLVDLRRLEMAGSVGTHQVARLAPGMAVAVRVEGWAQPVQARLARVAPAAEPGTRSIGVTVAIANADERLRAGQYAMAEVLIDDPQLRLTLPLSAVSESAGQSVVWTVAEGKLQRRAVTLGRRDEAGGRVEVLTGLDAGSRVLAARFDNLREGAAAQVADGPTAAGQAPAAAVNTAAAASTAPAAASARALQR